MPWFKDGEETVAVERKPVPKKNGTNDHGQRIARSLQAELAFVSQERWGGRTVEVCAPDKHRLLVKIDGVKVLECPPPKGKVGVLLFDGGSSVSRSFVRHVSEKIDKVVRKIKAARPA